MPTKFDLHTANGLAHFIDYLEGITREDLWRVLEANPTATGEDVADHFATDAATHYNGEQGYWGLAAGGFSALTNDPVAERAAFVQVGKQLLQEFTAKRG